MFMKSKYKVIERNETFGAHTDTSSERRTEGHTVSDIF